VHSNLKKKFFHHTYVDHPSVRVSSILIVGPARVSCQFFSVTLLATQMNVNDVDCVVCTMQVVDMSEDNFFSLIGDDYVTRDDLKLTDNCTPSSAEAVHELLKTAEANGDRVVVCILSSHVHISNISMTVGYI